jgi:RNA polymerase sigma-70 factor (ECF subfamily)
MNVVTDPPRDSRLKSEAGFKAVFEAEFGYVWNTLRRLGVRAADLPDLTHDVFVTFHRTLDKYDAARPLRPWLFGIAFRSASDYRRLARHRREELDSSPDPPDSTPDAERLAALREARSLVLCALERMEHDRRAVFVMHEIDGVGMPEIAAALEIPLNTGYSRLRLARSEFARAVAELGGVEKGGDP